ncbi:apolipoprotein N-acyltransferase [Paludibacter sp. 221]|uniref:apolipoprotein N-acyltransferase n=1 Tax=Paludibacter sp. 221 TaxID=2302939 RepID=UPI0013CFA89B|nr:apolipoprotein N-acyltransferase [Paludibacter sp. 221]NDV46351.1 apolipoprotein N-acyltransferase [Paludibacter sp. 221]
MKKLLPYLLAVISGFLFVSAWISALPGIVVLLCFIPLLYAEELIRNKPKFQVFLIGFVCFFTANLLSIWWLQKLISAWAILLYLYNALLASLVFLAFSIVKRKLGNVWGYAAFILFATAFEFICLNIDFSFPCILTGNMLFDSKNTFLIQWYEYTGVLGGSVWVLLCNVLLFCLIKGFIAKKSIKRNLKLLTISLVCILFPISLSLILYHTYTEENNPVEAVIVQPNFDPYTEKFTKSQDEQLSIMLALTKQRITQNTEYVVFPETALDSNIWLNNIQENYMVMKIRDSLLVDYPRAKVITGADMMQYYVAKDNKPPTSTAKKAKDRIYYDFFNVALQITPQGEIEVYKKSKLVLGTEYVPLVQQFPQLEKWIINLGGSAQSRGRQDKPSLLKSGITSVGTVICYESIYGEYVSKFAKIGAETICIISNDGWWDGTPAPYQHFRFAQLRAIENRRSVMRCANTGLSGFIDQRGNIIEKTEWWKQASINNNINKNSELTFYSQHGDYIGRICLFLSAILLLYLFYKNISDRRKQKSS